MSDVKYDAELCERLEREAREDDAGISPTLFVGRFTTAPHHRMWRDGGDLRLVDVRSLKRVRKNLRALADQLAAARAEIERLRKAGCDGIDAALESGVRESNYWRDVVAVELAKTCTGNSSECAIRARCTNKCGRLQRLDDAYRAARNKAGQ